MQSIAFSCFRHHLTLKMRDNGGVPVDASVASANESPSWHFCTYGVQHLSRIFLPTTAIQLVSMPGYDLTISVCLRSDEVLVCHFFVAFEQGCLYCSFLTWNASGGRMREGGLQWVPSSFSVDLSDDRSATLWQSLMKSPTEWHANEMLALTRPNSGKHWRLRTAIWPPDCYSISSYPLRVTV